MEGFTKALERSLIAGKLEANARKLELDAAACRRMAAVYRAGVEHALEGVETAIGARPAVSLGQCDSGRDTRGRA